MKKNRKLNIAVFISVFFRSFLIQAVWNYQSMLSIGFCFALAPVAKKLFKDRQKRIEFYNRHLNFFNAHPYFSSFALGAISRVEEDMALEGKDEYDKVDRLKNALIGPLGAIGDQLVWATLKPASILVCLLAVVLIESYETKIIFLFVLLVLYNIPHLYIRIFGLIKGYRAGYDVYKMLNIERFKTIKNIYGVLGGLALGIIIAYSILQSGESSGTYAIVFALSFLTAYFYKKIRKSVYMSLALPIILAVIAGIMFENL
jgi:mannose/fructose/N-acetylgalactosamine-specific phosphotransferase system component IID